MSVPDDDHLYWPEKIRMLQEKEWHQKRARMQDELKRSMEEKQYIADMLARVHQSPVPHPDTVRLKETMRQNKMLAEDHKALMAAIQKDLKAIRASCTTCDCPADVPSTDCPNNKMANTMTALVAAAMSAVGG